MLRLLYGTTCFEVMLNRRMPNGMYGGVRGERKSPLLDYKGRLFMEFKKNDILIVDIEDMGHDGEGIGKAQGYTLFIKDTVI